MTTVLITLALALAQDARSTLWDPIPAEWTAEDVDETPTFIPPEPLLQGYRGDRQFRLGPRAGYLKAREADRGTWHGGAQARVYFTDMFAGEAAISFHQDKFEDGDVIVTHYPLEVSAIVYPFRDWKVQPYAIGGLGWYYVRIDFRGDLASQEDETDSVFGLHVGGGAEVDAGPNVSLNADVRYVFLQDSDVEGIESEDYSYWQFTGGANIRF